MRLLVLGDAKTVHVQQLMSSSDSLHELTVAGLHEVSAHVDRAKGDLPEVRVRGHSARDFDVALIRAMPHGSLEQVITTMNLLGQLEKSGVPVINPARSLEVAIDKYLATAQLHGAGLTVPRTVVCQSVDEALVAFEAMSGDVVIKPLFGGEGRGVMRVQDREILERAARAILKLRAVIYLQAFVGNDGWDYRLFVLGERIWAMRRQSRGDWRTNLSRGATAEAVELSGELADIGRRAALAVDCVIAGVDVLPSSTGELFVLEVNAVPGWLGLDRALGVNTAPNVLQYLAEVASA